MDPVKCEKHGTAYVPFRGPGDPEGVPCAGCVTEAEAYWRQAEDQNIRASVGSQQMEGPDAQ